MNYRNQSDIGMVGMRWCGWIDGCMNGRCRDLCTAHSRLSMWNPRTRRIARCPGHYCLGSEFSLTSSCGGQRDNAPLRTPNISHVPSIAVLIAVP